MTLRDGEESAVATYRPRLLRAANFRPVDNGAARDSNVGAAAGRELTGQCELD